MFFWITLFWTRVRILWNLIELHLVFCWHYEWNSLQWNGILPNCFLYQDGTRRKSGTTRVILFRVQQDSHLGETGCGAQMFNTLQPIHICNQLGSKWSKNARAQGVSVVGSWNRENPRSIAKFLFSWLTFLYPSWWWTGFLKFLKLLTGNKGPSGLFSVLDVQPCAFALPRPWCWNNAA